MSTPHKRRSNAEILAANIAERKLPKKRVRRTKSQIARDKAMQAREKAKEDNSTKTKVKVVEFYAPMTIFGRAWKVGDEVWVRPGTAYYALAYDKNGDFVLSKTAAQQKELWDVVKYEVREEFE